MAPAGSAICRAVARILDFTAAAFVYRGATMIQRKLAVTFGFLLAACGMPETAEESERPTRGTSPLEATFEAAAAEYQVPVAVLKAIGYVETRLGRTGGASMTGGWGVMHLVERDDWNMLERAAARTGVDPARLKVDPHANIRGAAAVLRDLADQSFRQYGDLSPNDPADFFHAVSLYPGIESATLAQAYATDVYTAMDKGFVAEREDGTVVLSPTYTDWARHAPVGVRQDAVKEYPGAYQWVASPNFSYGRSSYQYVVIHTMQGSYSGCISWFKNPASNVSAHYLVRSSDGQITQMVEHRNTAWHAQCYNGRSIGIEHEGYVQDPARWYTDAMYRESARLTRWIADRHGIPRDRSHIIGHVNVPPACNTGGHYDPGTGWNWTKYMSLVNGNAPTPTSGKLTGVIYEGGNTNNRVAGAVVTVAGQTKTTGTDGLYEFVLNPGTYTVSVSKSGYSSASVSRTVTSGATVWGSMEINPVASTGTLRGKVFVYNPANPTDMSQGIAGATVSTGGQTVQSDASGFYLFTLSPGTYTVNVSKSGYAPSSVTRTVTSGTTTWGSVGLSPDSAPDQQPPQLAVTFPQDGAHLELAMLALTGTASDDRGPVAQVKLSLNGGAPVDVPVSNGAFSYPVKLSPGPNTIEVSATDGMGNQGTARTTATFHAGVSGFVHLAEDEATRLPGVQVEIRRADGAVVTSASTGADGRFTLELTQVPAEYVLVARKEGFITHTETVNVPDDARLNVVLPLTRGEDPRPDNVEIVFTDPADGAHVSTEAVTVYGTVSGMQLASITISGVAGELLGAGGFAVTVPLEVGENRLEAVATGANGETATKTLTVFRRATGSLPEGDGAQVKAGCAAAPSGALMFAVAALLPLVRRRR